MIKVGIAGADNPVAGELIRILVNHPDVDIRTLYAPACKGRGAESVHHGLIGEQKLTFSDAIDPAALDFLFILDRAVDPAALPEELMWVEMSGRTISEMPEDIVYGLSEAFRKPLVRGARHAFIPNPVASAALIAINPLALNLLVGDDLKIDVTVPAGPSEQATDAVLKEAADELAKVLPLIQNSFSGRIACEAKGETESRRAMRVAATICCGMDISEIVPLFENVYDDHNFTFLTNAIVSDKEVEGTNKCILRLTRPDFSTLRVEALVDPSMRGGAGEAVHVLNLLCGLHEKTGLALKSAAL